MENTILAIDAALGPCSVAVLRGEALLAHAREERPQMQAARLVPMVEEALKTAGLGYAELDAIVCTTGPGMFTGIRIGLAAARGIGFAAKKPVHGVSTLATLAVEAKKHAEGPIFAAINAGKGEAYCQMFHVEQNIYFVKQSDPALVSPEALADLAGHNTLIVGNILPEWAASHPFLPLMPDAIATARAFAHPNLVSTPEPFYIRPPDAKPAA